MGNSPESPAFLAFDFGAESARAVAGVLFDKKLEIKEVHRFSTRMLSMNDHCYWNVFRFYEEMIQAMALCTGRDHLVPVSVAVDTWGVDFGILSADGFLLRIPYAYRDPQVVKAMPDYHKRIMPPESIYSRTGISMQPFNSLYQLHAMRCNHDFALESGDRIMFLPDLLNYMLCGEKKTEFSFATTTQLYNPVTATWDRHLLESVGLSLSRMNETVNPGRYLGRLHSWISEQTGMTDTLVANVCSHDTGSAIVAVPAQGSNWAFISSGTWSLMGIELTTPVISEKSFAFNFSNEGGAGGSFSLLKNIMGLWILQQCQRVWEASGINYSYRELIEMAEKSQPFKTLIDPDYLGFYNPPDMTEAIGTFCQVSGQQPPVSVGSFVRTIFESLALKYRQVLGQIKEVSGREPDAIHIIGGGSRNALLCQFAANATAKPVIAGPAEGTAVGNIMMQAMAGGYVSSLEEIREVVANTFGTVRYEPQDSTAWAEAFKRFEKICTTGADNENV